MNIGKNCTSITRYNHHVQFFFAKYDSMDLYDEDLENIFIIDHEQLKYDKNSGLTLIGITEKPDGTMVDHEYFCIHGDLFDIIKSTHQDNNIILKFISNESNENESQCGTTKICDDNIQNKKITINKKSTKHTLQRKSQNFQ